VIERSRSDGADHSQHRASKRGRSKPAPFSIMIMMAIIATLMTSALV
jgi:hypothetical protein